MKYIFIVGDSTKLKVKVFFEKDNILFQQVSIIVDLRVSRSEIQHVFLEVRVKMSLQIRRCGDEVDSCDAPLDE